MKRYEHQVIEAIGGLPDVFEQLGEEWRFAGLESGIQFSRWVFVREVPAPEPATMLMEISQQVEAMATSTDDPERLSRLAACIAALARGEAVTMEDILGKPTS